MASVGYTEVARPGRAKRRHNPGLLSGLISREEVEEAGSLEAVYAKRAEIDPIAQRVMNRLIRPLPAYTPPTAVVPPKRKKYSLPFGMTDPEEIRTLRKILE